MVDYKRQLKFPQHIVTSTLRPEMLLGFNFTKPVILLELTVPWEDHLEVTFERKFPKYLVWSENVSKVAREQNSRQ